jgi:hypothetical protein
MQLKKVAVLGEKKSPNSSFELSYKKLFGSLIHSRNWLNNFNSLTKFFLISLLIFSNREALGLPEEN